LAGVPVERATRAGADPEVCFVAGQGSYWDVGEAGLEEPEGLAVVEQEPCATSADEEVSGGQWEDGGDVAICWVGGAKLLGGAVCSEEEQAFAVRGGDQGGGRCAAETPGGEGDDGRGWKVEAGVEELRLAARLVIDTESAGAGEVELAVKGCAGGVTVARGDGLEGCADGLQREQREREIAFCADLLADGFEARVEVEYRKARGAKYSQEENGRDTNGDLTHFVKQTLYG